MFANKLYWSSRLFIKLNVRMWSPFFDAFYDEGSVFIALEFMNGGSLGDVLKNAGVIPEQILVKIVMQVLKGLNYLHKSLHLVHRDIKPCNLLLNRNGEVKISDFGVSGQLEHTLSKCSSWVGTVTYMSPERIQAASHSFDSDIWALGLSLIECALGRYPYPKNIGSPHRQLDFWELTEFILKDSPPSLPPDKFSKELCLFTEACLQKLPEERPSAASLLNHAWIKNGAARKDVDLAEWLQKWII